MKQFASWQAPFYSFWSKSFYVDVAKNWRGLAYIYLFFVICFTWVFMSIKKQIDMSYFADHVLSPVVEQMPRVAIEKGELSIDRASPYTLNSNSGQPVITFDVREKPMTLADAPGTFLVTKDSILCKGQPEEQKIDLTTIDHAVIDKKSAHQFIADFVKSVALIVFMIMVPLGFIFCVLQSLVYGLIGDLICRMHKAKMSYGTLVRLSTVALTPVLLIDSIIKVRGLESPLWAVSASIITIGYIIFAVRANIENPENKPEEIDS